MRTAQVSVRHNADLHLDTNCLIAIDENRAEAKSVRALADAHAGGRAHVAVMAISASEKQQALGEPQGHCPTKKWRNAKCDVLAIWGHVHSGRDVFVTSDGDFHVPSKKAALIALGAGRIKYPESAVQLIP